MSVCRLNFVKPLLPTKLNICLVTKKFPIFGRAAEYSFLWPIAKGLASREHEVTVIADESPTRSAEVTNDGVRAIYISENSQLSRYNFKKAARIKFADLHREKPFHIVHSLDSSGAEIAQFKKQYKVASTIDVKATQMAQLFAIQGMSQENLGSLLRTDFSITYKFLRTYFGGDRKLLKSADGVFVTSPHQRIVLERYYMYPDSRIYTVPYGIEIGDLTPKEKSEALRDELKLPKDGNAVVTITDMSELEEIKNLLLAFEKVAIKKNDSRLIIVGNGPKRKEIEYEVYMLALGSKVIFTGAVNNQDLADYIGLADVFVNLSTRTTGFEASMLEAMAQKKVVIGSEVSAMANIIEDGIDGFLIRPADVHWLSQLLIHIFTGQIMTVEIGDRARRKIINLFDTTKMVDETINAYFKILKRTKMYKVADE